MQSVVRHWQPHHGSAHHTSSLQGHFPRELLQKSLGKNPRMPGDISRRKLSTVFAVVLGLGEDVLAWPSAWRSLEPQRAEVLALHRRSRAAMPTWPAAVTTAGNSSEMNRLRPVSASALRSCSSPKLAAEPTRSIQEARRDASASTATRFTRLH